MDFIFIFISLCRIIVYLFSHGQCHGLYIIWLNLLCTCIFGTHVMVFLMNCYEELLYACVHITHVEASWFELLCRTITCVTFSCVLAFLFRSFMNLLAHVTSYIINHCEGLYVRVFFSHYYVELLCTCFHMAHVVAYI